MNLNEALDILKQTSPLRITVSGAIGAGKSTFAKRIAAELGIPRIYMGQVMREEAARRGLTLDGLNELLVNDDQVDRDLDAMQTKKGEELERAVFEGRTSWHFIKGANIRLFFDASEEEAANRIWEDGNDMRDKYASKEELIVANQKRKENEVARYEGYYGIDVYNPENFDITVDTTDLSIDGVFEEAVIKMADILAKNLD